MTDNLLTTTRDTIARERGNFHASFDRVRELLAAFGEARLAERLYEAIPPSRPWEDVADLFGILSWDTSDNGAGLLRTMEQWLRSADDVRKVRIALHQDAYPFLDRDEMERSLAIVAERHPVVAPRCRELIESRRQLRETGE